MLLAGTRHYLGGDMAKLIPRARTSTGVPSATRRSTVHHTHATALHMYCLHNHPPGPKLPSMRGYKLGRAAVTATTAILTPRLNVVSHALLALQTLLGIAVALGASFTLLPQEGSTFMVVGVTLLCIVGLGRLASVAATACRSRPGLAVLHLFSPAAALWEAWRVIGSDKQGRLTVTGIDVRDPRPCVGSRAVLELRYYSALRGTVELCLGTALLLAASFMPEAVPQPVAAVIQLLMQSAGAWVLVVAWVVVSCAYSALALACDEVESLAHTKRVHDPGRAAEVQDTIPVRGKAWIVSHHGVALLVRTLLMMATLVLWGPLALLVLTVWVVASLVLFSQPGAMCCGGWGRCCARMARACCRCCCCRSSDGGGALMTPRARSWTSRARRGLRGAGRKATVAASPTAATADTATREDDATHPTQGAPALVYTFGCKDPTFKTKPRSSSSSSGGLRPWHRVQAALAWCGTALYSVVAFPGYAFMKSFPFRRRRRDVGRPVWSPFAYFGWRVVEEGALLGYAAVTYGGGTLALVAVLVLLVLRLVCAVMYMWTCMTLTAPVGDRSFVWMHEPLSDSSVVCLSCAACVCLVQVDCGTRGRCVAETAAAEPEGHVGGAGGQVATPGAVQEGREVRVGERR